MTDQVIQTLIKLFSKLPGFGPRSGRRCALYLIKNNEQILQPLIESMRLVAQNVQICSVCYSIDTCQPCSICCDSTRDSSALCVVEDVDDLWALERSKSFRGKYFVLGGVLSAVTGIGTDALHMDKLFTYVRDNAIAEVILGLSATVDGQTTAHVIAAELQSLGVKITALSHGIPMGGELDYLDDGTLNTAFRSRRSFL